MKFDRDPGDGGGKIGMGSVVIITIRFTALGLDSSRSNRISLERSIIQSHLISFERVVHPKSIGRMTIIHRECSTLPDVEIKVELWSGIYIYIYIIPIDRKEILINGLKCSMIGEAMKETLRC